MEKFVLIHSDWLSLLGCESVCEEFVEIRISIRILNARGVDPAIINARLDIDLQFLSKHILFSLVKLVSKSFDNKILSKFKNWVSS